MLISILLNNNLDPLDAVIQFLMIVFVFTFSLSLREFFRAFAAYKMGDATAKSMGMMTINPIKHIDPAGFLFFVLLGVGWSKPVPINPTNFKTTAKALGGCPLPECWSTLFLVCLRQSFIWCLIAHWVVQTKQWVTFTCCFK